MSINLNYLMNSVAKNLMGEAGTVVEVSQTGDSHHVVLNFNGGRKATFCFCSNGNYITKYLTFTDKAVQERLAADIEEHKSMQISVKQEEKAPLFTSSVTQSYTSGSEEIRFGKTHELYGDFSNFKGATFYDGRQYKCSEAAWQSMKTLDHAVRDEFSALSGSMAKRKGRSVKLRPDWELIKDELMADVCYAKFSQNQYLKDLLLSTGDSTLIENTTGWHDNYWGDCQCPKCINKPGQNHLGIALMRVREQLRNDQKTVK